MDATNSPLFPAPSLTLSPTFSTENEAPSLVPQLPDKPLAHGTSIQVYLIPTEKTLFVSGFEQTEYADRPPSLLRGCLVVRVQKATKIKSISLLFKGRQRTDWPEGIPPKKNTHMEVNDVLSHTWPFFQAGVTSHNGGANEVFREKAKGGRSSSPNDSHSKTLSPVRSTDSGMTGSSNILGRGLSPVASIIKKGSSQNGTSDLASLDLMPVSSIPEGDTTKSGLFSPGDYVYNFEQPIPASVPESTSATFGLVYYYLEVEIVRMGTFKFNISATLPIDIVRLPSELNMEENDPIVISKDWEDQLRYEIVISGRSVVLNSYLPMAFRFIPLYGKVQLHRIRVYITESLEYYCQDKRVHRQEPQRMFLLMEHRAAKGKSLLAKYSDVDDENQQEILPRELEFQLYVPEFVNSKTKYKLHPDTSFENIQCHHWIKIRLRISRLDPENPEKRKHYEILIDSPLHVLSPLAAHGNTLLPAYDNLMDESQMPISLPGSPPLSPGVIPIEESFRHINGLNNNDEAIERDGNMHLEANLYKPDPSQSDAALSSPQAVPHPGTFSPVLSPVQRPIHLLRRPSFAPPPFEEAKQSDQHAAPPPSYNEAEFSLSPLRIDEPDHNNGQTARRSEPFIGNHPLSTPIKDLLGEQLKVPSKSRSTSRSISSENVSKPERKEISTEPGRVEPESKAEDITEVNESTPRLNNGSSQEFTPTDVNPALLLEDEDDDIANFGHPNPPYSSQNENSTRSRQSSTVSDHSSAASVTDMPLEQTVPLLNISTSSFQLPERRRSSIGSILEDIARRPSQLTYLSTNMADIMRPTALHEEDNILGSSLILFQNPRRQKHYQDFEASHDRRLQESTRHKLFGMVNENNDFESEKVRSSESIQTLKSDSKDEPGSHSEISKDRNGVLRVKPGLATR